MKRKLLHQDASYTRPLPSAPPLHGPTSIAEPTAPLRSRPPCFAPDASIALVGLRGVGKSTIGVIISSNLRRRLIDADVQFVTATGMTAAQYVSTYGWPRYRVKEAELLATILRQNSSGCVIVLSSGCVEKPTSRALLQKWMLDHPVIHIIRQEKDLEGYFRSQAQKPNQAAVEASIQALHRLIVRLEPLFRACSNLEFFNVWDKRISQITACPRISSQEIPTLKRVEQDILGLLNFAFKSEMAALIVRDRNSYSDPTSTVVASATLEDRMYTYALTLPPTPSFGSIDNASLDWEGIGATVQAFDFRVDYLLHSLAAKDSKQRALQLRFISQQFGIIRRHSHLPIIFHVRTVSQGGCFPSSSDKDEDDYFGLLLHAVRLGAEYVAVEISKAEHKILSFMDAKGGTKIIGSQFEARTGGEWTWDGSERRKAYDRAARLGCDIVNLSQRAMNVNDNFAAISFAWEIKRRRAECGLTSPTEKEHLPPLIAFNTGKLGKMSLFFNSVLSPVTHPLLNEHLNANRAAFGQELTAMDESDLITPKEALTAVYAAGLLPRRQFCIFGAAIGHSLSPAMYNAAFEAYGMPHNYRFYNASSINEILHVVQDPNFGGASIVVPFKLEIITLLQSLSDHARAIGAVNTIWPIQATEDTAAHTALHGDNTDWIGIRACALRYLSPVNTITDQTSALIIGAGGMARAGIYALQKLGVQNIFLYNRNVERAVELARHFNERNQKLLFSTSSAHGPHTNSGLSLRYAVKVIRSFAEVWPTGSRLPTIIVSCVPAHSIMGAPPANITLPNEWLQSPTGGVCIELAYKPRITPLLRQIRSLAHKGWTGVDGLEVLPEQAFAQFQMFLGREAPRRIMKEAVMNAYIE